MRLIDHSGAALDRRCTGAVAIAVGALLAAACQSTGAGGGRAGIGGGTGGVASPGGSGGRAGDGGAGAGGVVGVAGAGGASTDAAVMDATSGAGGATTDGSADGGGGNAGRGAGGGGGAAGRGGSGGAAGRGGAAGGGGNAGGGNAGGGSGGNGGAGGSASSCSVAPAGEMVVSVAGTWTFTPSGASATTIAVPGGGWIAQGFPRSVSAARYERTVSIPDLGRPQATYVEFGAVNHEATLSVDGTKIATNTTSFTPSVFDVTGAVRAGASQKITVDVKGRDALHAASGKTLVPDGANWSANIPQGIFRSATVRAVPALHVYDAFVRTDVAGDKISVDVWVKNAGSAAANGSVSVALSSWNCDRWQYPSLPAAQVSVPAGQTTKVTLGPVGWGLGSSSYWWPNVPYANGYRAKLHIATVTVTPDAAGGGTAAAHAVPIRFGFRQSRQVGTHYELNGVRVNFRGDNIQGADYDSINNGKGPGGAYDLFAGFLPPSASNAGWPGAVDNWQRLNYDVSRIHQVPASPYMLDVMDEMGFMVIDETAIRGAGDGQDFVAGAANMLGHLDALIRRDRNHPCVIRWSQCNEPEFASTNSASFQQQLYNTAIAADDTRPVSADSSSSGASFRNGYPTAANFAVFEHYPNSVGQYTDRVDASSTTPFGVGEFIWPADNSKKGLTWFATSTMTMRQKDASDLRPYTLLSGWASFVPGVKKTAMTIEQGGAPLFGEDNLSDPWSSPIITRIQRAFNPVAVADVAYWDENKLSDANGTWPVSPETVARGAKLTRQLVVFNDTFSGTGVDVAWEMHADSATGAITDQGGMHVDVALGQRATASLTVTAPSSGTNAVLILQSSKNGVVIFRDDAELFRLQ